MAQELYDVAIVGFGPAGAMAAALLGQAGVRVYACDRLDGVYEIPRAIALDHEIMRVFQQIGVVDQVAAYCEPFTPSEYYGVDGQLIRRMTMVSPPYPQGYTPSLVFTQPPVERILRERVAQLPTVDVTLGVEVRSVEQTGDTVTLGVFDREGREQPVRAKYVIACDGGASTVRTLVGIALEDLDFDEPWLVVDVLVNERGLAKLPKTSVQYCEPDRPSTFVIGPQNHRRWEISLKPGEDPKAVAQDEATWQLLSRWITPEDGTLWRQSSYRFHALVASEWRQGRVFLAGDAAHMQPPFLGQGMCQGIRDVANLSWKLVRSFDPACSAEAAEALLNSYGTERKAHVRELTTRIKAFGAVICERDPAKARARDADMLKACGGTVTDTPRQDILPRLEQGFLSARPSSARGTLFPQPRLEADGALMDTRHGTGWRLVLERAADRPAAGVSAPGLHVIVTGEGPDAERDGVVRQWMTRHECVAALVRPDQYVFGVAAQAADIGALVAEWSQRIA